MYIKEFTLKQHTPIIHFQSEDTGATLRASEVKPKLDKFIYKKWLEIEKGDTESIFLKYGHFTVGKTKEKWEKELAKFHKLDESEKKEYLENYLWALDYALSFVAINYEEIPIEKKHRNSPMYFGNMGDDPTEYKHFVFSDGVVGKIKCKHKHKKDEKEDKKELLDYILDYLPEFFFLNNFGTRQSKGYGSFTVESIDKKTVNFDFSSKYSFILDVDNWKKAMTQLGFFYESLRSGINTGKPKYNKVVEGNHPNAFKQQYFNTGFYMKPVIFLYAKSLNKQWDKKSIKEQYFNKDYSYRKATYKEKENEFIERLEDKDKNYYKKLRPENKKEYIKKNEEELGLKGKSLIETLGLKKQIEKRKEDILTFSSEKKKNEYHYDFRDLLGLSSDEEWYSYGAKIKKKNKNIDRFKSPITFKPIKTSDDRYDIFIHLDEIDKKYKGKIFEVSMEDYKGLKTRLKLQIPPNIEMENLFDFIAHKYDITQSVKSNFHNYFDKNLKFKPYEMLKLIYNQLRIK